jgi:hypothetical protein
MAKRGFAPFFLLTTFVFCMLFFSSQNARDTWQRLPQQMGLGERFGYSLLPEYFSSESSMTSSPQHKDVDFANWNPKPNFQPGTPMPQGHNWTSTLVIAKVKDEDTDWLERELPDQPKAVYVADDPSAPLHPPRNKAHEVMIYLSWIIDNYDALPDVAIFMHAHQIAWHNEDILGYDAVQLIKRLSRGHVWRQGYVNLRCSWYPGCPDWMHPGETEENEWKQEEVLLAKSWSELFPLDKVPPVLAQPCCAQFALSRERIQAKPHAQYLWYREWLFSTKIPDHLSGRIWEYIWQVVFTGKDVFCPQEHVCFCEQFGCCFGGEDQFEAFLKQKNEMNDRERDLREWEDNTKALEDAMKEGKWEEANKLEKPEPGLDQRLKAEIDRLRPPVQKLLEEAIERGYAPRNRAKEAGREWVEE